MRPLRIFLIFCILSTSFSQDFIGSLEVKEQESHLYELNGHVRGAFFAGKSVSSDELVQKSGYGELGLKMRVRKGQWGDGYADVRFRHGYEFDESLAEFRLREAYVNSYLNHFSLRLGQQVVVWGRADAYNPTNNITPQDMTARSAVEDDRRLGNFLFRGTYHFQPFSLECIWVPQYRPSVLPTMVFPFPDFVTLGQEDDPNSELQNSTLAAKLDLGLSSVDGSLSYFRGYMPLPGVYLHPDSITIEGNGIKATVINKPYQMHVIGGDFSTTLGSMGIRGEIAWRQPFEDYENPLNMHVPYPDVQYVFGVDRTFGDLSIIAQYIGRYVINYRELKTSGLPTDQLYLTNRMINGQLDQTSHALFLRPAWALLHETLNLEVLAYYSLTTEEGLWRPVATYDIADALTLKLGGDFYLGPDNTLFGQIDRALSALFIELGASF
ncbi:hypothetical protein JW998_11570 [candidate division KSB1 bacterium]|nr:hypothetical protein [candidate division KSB1 bacterium]